jgi:2-polyprenyl-3-methyl-5-hydroxy-6-metoxy-1,4-benzoquinol methylase
MIDSKHLKLIIEIDKVGSLSKASKRLYLTQSALSHQLKKLEDYLGVKVFHRIDNQLLFTEAGKELRDRAKAILGEYEELESRINEIKASQLSKYIHGYSPSEAQRLLDQATTVADYLHFDSVWEKGSTILEVGCGVGAQTEIIAQKNPHSNFVAIDISENSLKIAQSKMAQLGIKNVVFRQEDIRNFKLNGREKFDHIFVCFLLEHLRKPAEVLLKLKDLIKEGGSITVIEGDHGSTFFHPDNLAARKVVQAQVELQQRKGGNANIGRSLFPLLKKAGFADIDVSPRQIYVDESKPKLVEGFIKNTFTAMIQGMAEDIIAEKILSLEEVKAGIEGLLETSKADGAFSYTFFKAKGLVERE